MCDFIVMLTYPAFIIKNLDLSGVAEFDHGSHRNVKLSARFKVQPHIVALHYKTALVKNMDDFTLNKQTQNWIKEEEELIDFRLPTSFNHSHR